MLILGSFLLEYFNTRYDFTYRHCTIFFSNYLAQALIVSPMSMHRKLHQPIHELTRDWISIRIWSTFIPFHYLQVFQRGAYYAVEVIPDEMAVISLNTMYFYDSNKGELNLVWFLLSDIDIMWQRLLDVYLRNQTTQEICNLIGWKFNWMRIAGEACRHDLPYESQVAPLSNSSLLRCGCQVSSSVELWLL